MTADRGSGGNSVGGQAHVNGPLIQAGSVTGGIHHHQPVPQHPPTPREIPPLTGGWVDRKDSLRALTRACADDSPFTVRCLAVSGPGGVGKTALAVRWLREVSDQFPDGQLYADLRGHGQQPLQPAALLSRFLRAFGVGLASPAPAGDPDELAAWWRSVTATKKIAVFADNACDAQQVRPLLPGGEGSLLLVTSRSPLTGLATDGAFLHRLSPLAEDAAVLLLTRCGGREDTGADGTAAARVAVRCSGLPLALRTAAATLATHPELTFAQLADALANTATTRTTAHFLDPEDIAVAAAAHQGYVSLPPDAADAYRRLGALPADLLDRDDVAAVCSVGLDEGERLLLLLADANLVQDLSLGAGPGRYRFFDQVKDHAAQFAAGDGEEFRSEVVRRWIGQCLSNATAAEALLTPSHRSLPRSYDATLPAPFTEPGQALGWLETRLHDLMAAVRAAFAAGWFDLTWQLVDAMWPAWHRLRPYEIQVEAHQDYGLPAAREVGNRLAVRRMLTSLGGALRNTGRPEEALPFYQEALASALNDGDLRDQSQAQNGIGTVHYQAGRFAQAIPALQTSLVLRDAIGYGRGVGITYVLLGDITSASGEHQAAVAYLSRARALLLAAADPHDAARALAFLGRAHSRRGDHDEAVLALRQAEREFAAIGSAHWCGQTWEWLGLTAQARGHDDDARDCFQRSLAVYEPISPTDTARLRRRLQS